MRNVSGLRLSSLPFGVAVLVTVALALGPASARAKPEDKPDGKKPSTLPRPGKPEDRPEGEIDWRGLYRMDENGHTIKRDPPPPNPIRELAQSAPYRVHVASSDGKKLTITDAYTLERWRLLEDEAIAGYAFSNDGHYLYAVHGANVLSSVVVETGKASAMSRLELKEGEVVIEVIGHGNRGHRFVTVVVGQGPPPRVGQPCGSWRGLRRLRVRQRSSWPKATVIVEKGPHDLRRKRRKKGTSPNTRYEVLLGSQLMLNNKIGGGSVGKVNRKPLPPRALGFEWMRDSRGVVVKAAAPSLNGCRHRLTLRSFRQPATQRKAWYRQRNWEAWQLPADVELVPGSMDHQDVEWTPDGMRVIGVQGGRAVLIEPLPRHRGHVSVITPPIALWPVVRPGVRSLATGTGVLRHAEILAEQGDLDSARRQLAAALQKDAGKPSPEEVARLRKRLARLDSIRQRRAAELGESDASLRGQRALPVDGGTAAAVDDSPPTQ